MRRYSAVGDTLRYVASSFTVTSLAGFAGAVSWTSGVGLGRECLVRTGNPAPLATAPQSSEPDSSRQFTHTDRHIVATERRYTGNLNNQPHAPPTMNASKFG